MYSSRKPDSLFHECVKGRQNAPVLMLNETILIFTITLNNDTVIKNYFSMCTFHASPQISIYLPKLQYANEIFGYILDPAWY